MAMLEVKNLSKSFGQLDVLKDISFSVSLPVLPAPAQ